MNPLSPFGWLYGLAAKTRNSLYDRQIFKSHSLGVRTISIGNLTTGGTGKTPLVALVASILAEGGEKVCILSRGYGRKNKAERVLVSDGNTVLCDAVTGGDEPVELAHKLIGKASVVVSADRVTAAEWATMALSPTVFILDDAFQHRRVRRDLDIVCVDSTNPFGNGQILPAGTLRENKENLDRADLIVITRTDLVKDVSDIEKEIRRLNDRAPVFRSANKISGFVPVDEFTQDIRSDTSAFVKTDSPAMAFCGLGNPSNFFRQLEKEGVDLRGRKTFPDHYFYTQKDIDEVAKKARAVGAECLITTVKDAVRLTGLNLPMPIFVATIETHMADPAEFRAAILS